MEFIFYNEIVSYIDDNNFIKDLSLISKNETLKKRRKKINHLNVLNNLNDKILFFSNNYFSNHVYDYSDDLDIIFDNLNSLKIKLLDERIDVKDISHQYYPRHSKIVVDKFSTSRFLNIYEDNTFDDDFNFNYIEWFSNDNTEIKIKELICPIYRMSLMDREILLSNFPYAKALIY
jgi:hypothetical protein